MRVAESLRRAALRRSTTGCVVVAVHALSA
jgi:hypothetical protein